MTHAGSLKVLTQRWVMSHLTRAQCCPVSVWVIQRERYPDTENQSRVVRTCIVGDLTLTQRPTLALTPPCVCCWYLVAPPELCNVCNAQILSVIKIFYIPVEIIIADCSPCHAVIQQGAQCQGLTFLLSHNNSSNHLFSVPRPGSWRRVMCCDEACHDKMHLSRVSTGFVSVSHDNISPAHNI